ncbi:RNA-directed DNA polymerase, eukaryota [Tanacetum coccineum]
MKPSDCTKENKEWNIQELRRLLVQLKPLEMVSLFKSTPLLVQLKPLEMVSFIKKTDLPLAIPAFTTFLICNATLELLKVCTNILEEVETSFVSQIQDWSLCGSKRRGKDFAFGMTLKLLREEKRNLVAMIFIDEDEIGWDKMRYTCVNDPLMLQTWLIITHIPISFSQTDSRIRSAYPKLDLPSGLYYIPSVVSWWITTVDGIEYFGNNYLKIIKWHGDEEFIPIKKSCDDDEVSKVESNIVSRKKHGYRSYEDDVAKISISIYVSNLPETFSAKDLFHACNKYGHVVDSFIPLKRSKEGKRFGFVKFINVSNVERLVGNLCTVWVGRYKLQANKARFGRPPLNGRNIRNSKSDDRHLGGFKEPNVRPTNGNKETRNNSFASVLKSNQPNNLSSSNMIHDSSPAIALDDDCLSANDLSCVAIGKIKDINALSNLSVILNDEGFDDIKISYLGGYWVLIQSKSCASKEKLINHAGVLNWFHELGNANNSFVSDIRLVWIAIEGLPMCAWNNKALSKIVSPWGTLTPVDLVEDSSLPYRKVCVTTKVSTIINDRTKIIVKGKVYWIRIRELEPWSPELDDEFCESSSDDELIFSSVGLSGGILCVWDPNSFVKDNATISDYFVAVRGTWLSTATKVMFVSIYAPQDISEKKSLWEYITHIIDTWDGECIILGDFNEVRSKQERHLSDHRPIIMREVVTDYGPSPFRVYQSWFHKKGFDKLIKDSWSYSSSNDSNKIILLKKKLQALKASIKEWCKDDIKRSNDTCFSIKARLSDLDNTPLDLAQKAKVRWAIEGDENSKYFHGIINKKRSQLAIRGVLIDGDWIDEPCKVKNEFLMHFANRFESPSGPCIDIDCHLFKKLSSEQVDDLECDVTFDEIKKAVWDCGTNKSPEWDFLDIILRNFGFGIKWRGWIQGCLSSAMGSILVNGIRFDDSLTLSHLFYADDAVFIGKWDRANILTIVRMLKCFFLASGLQINILKSKLMGIGVSNEEQAAANIMGVLLFPLRSLNLGVEDLFLVYYALRLKKEYYGCTKNSLMIRCASFRRNPRGGVEEEQLHVLVELVGSISLSPSNDRWAWLLGSSGEFSVHSARTFIDDILLPFVGDVTRWVKVVPIKVMQELMFLNTSIKDQN